jgi:hypothetical protein
MPQLFSAYTALVLSLVTLALACARSCRHGFLQPGTAVSLVAAAVAVTLFVPKPSTDADWQSCGVLGLASIVRPRPLAFIAVGGDCHSLRHSVAHELVPSDLCFPHAFQVCAPGSSEGHQGPRPGLPVLSGARRTVPDVDE